MRNGDVSLRFAPFDMTFFGDIGEREGKNAPHFSLLFILLQLNRRHFVAEQSEARNLVINVPLGTKLFYFSKTYLTARLIEEIIVFYRYEVPNGTASLFERTNFVGLSYYGSHYKRGAATM